MEREEGSTLCTSQTGMPSSGWGMAVLEADINKTFHCASQGRCPRVLSVMIPARLAAAKSAC